MAQAFRRATSRLRATFDLKLGSVDELLK